MLETAGRNEAHVSIARRPAQSLATQPGLIIIIAATTQERLRLASSLPAGATVLLAADVQQAGRVVAQLPPSPEQPHRHVPWSPHVHLQRQNRTPQQPSQSQLRLRADRLSLSLGAREVPLTKLELDLLAHLLPRVGETVTFEQLSHVAWHTDYLGNGAHMHAAVGRLRAKLAKLDAPVTLQAVRGLGFRLISHRWEGSLREVVGS